MKILCCISSSAIYIDIVAVVYLSIKIDKELLAEFCHSGYTGNKNSPVRESKKYALLWPVLRKLRNSPIIFEGGRMNPYFCMPEWFKKAK